jgi:hypothetical protein
VCRASKIQHEDLTSAGVRLPFLVVDGTFFMVYGIFFIDIWNFLCNFFVLSKDEAYQSFFRITLMSTVLSLFFGVIWISHFY